MTKEYIEVIYKIITDNKELEKVITPKLRTLKIEKVDNYKEDFKKYIKHKQMSEFIVIMLKWNNNLKECRNILLDIIVDWLDNLEKTFDKDFKIEVSDINDLIS